MGVSVVEKPWDAPGEITVHSLPRYACVDGKPCENAEILEYDLTTNRGLMNFFGILVVFEGTSGWGCSRVFGMPLDGDGPERFHVMGSEFEAVKKRVRESLNQATATGRSLVVAYNGDFDRFKMTSVKGKEES